MILVLGSILVDYLSRPSRTLQLLAPIVHSPAARAHRAALQLLAPIARSPAARAHRALSSCSRPSRALQLLAPIAPLSSCSRPRALSSCSVLDSTFPRDR